MGAVNSEIDRYIAGHIDPEPGYLADINRETHLRCLYPEMCSGHHQGRMLKMLTRMIRPMRVLELGTFTGYSALCLAEGAPDGCAVHTVEHNDEMEDFIRHNFSTAPHPVASKITLHIGDALATIGPLSESAAPRGWDMVFIDANKRQYSDYYRAVLPHVAPGGFIIADNTLWYGKVDPASGAHDAQTTAILRFNEEVAADPAVETVILPLRDGLTILRKT